MVIVDTSGLFEARYTFLDPHADLAVGGEGLRLYWRVILSGILEKWIRMYLKRADGEP